MTQAKSRRFGFVFLAGVLFSTLALAIGCGGGSGPPVYSDGSTYLEEREGRQVLVYEFSITDGDGNPYTGPLLVEGTAFTPGGVDPILESNRAGKVEIILEPTTAGEYRIAIQSFIDPEGQTYRPLPDDTKLSGVVVLAHTYAP